MAINQPNGGNPGEGYAVGINMYPASSILRADYGWHATLGQPDTYDGAILVANSLMFGQPTVVPEPASLAIFAAAAGLIAARRRF